MYYSLHANILYLFHCKLEFFIKLHLFRQQLQGNVLELLIIALYVFHCEPQYFLILYTLLLANTTQCTGASFIGLCILFAQNHSTLYYYKFVVLFELSQNDLIKEVHLQ